MTQQDFLDLIDEVGFDEAFAQMGDHLLTLSAEGTVEEEIELPAGYLGRKLSTKHATLK